jgi:hypothetical protein
VRSCLLPAGCPLLAALRMPSELAESSSHSRSDTQSYVQARLKLWHAGLQVFSQDFSTERLRAGGRPYHPRAAQDPPEEADLRGRGSCICAPYRSGGALLPAAQGP